MNQKVKNTVTLLICVILLTVLDQATKYLAVLHLSPQEGGTDVLLLKGVFRLRYLENRGAAFGIFQGQKTILVVTTVVVLRVLCWLFFHLPLEKHFSPLRWLIIFILAGAAGNFIDRMCLGYVIDFFYFEFIDFPIFNVADIYVTCSVVLLIILFLFYYKEEDLNRIWPGKRKGEA